MADGDGEIELTESEVSEAIAEMTAFVNGIPEDRSDAGLAKWLGETVMKDRFAWNTADGWMIYDDNVGVYRALAEQLMLGAISEALTDVADKIVALARADDGDIKAARQEAAPLRTAKKASSVRQLIYSHILIEADEFDTHPDLLCCGNGVVNLKTGKLQPFDAALRLTKHTRVEYVAGAESDDWSAILSAMDADVVPWAQTRWGQAATGHRAANDQITFNQGQGSNGKSTFINVMKKALGGYCAILPKEIVLGGRNSRSDGPEVMLLRGLRVGIIEELPDEGHLSMERIKTIVGTGSATARSLYKDYVTFPIMATLFVNTNPRPIVKETEHATWRRLKMCTWSAKFVGSEKKILAPHERRKDPLLEQKIQSDPEIAQAALAWVVAGAVRYSKKGYVGDPASVRLTTESWRAENDLVWTFVSSHLEFDKAKCVAAADVLAAMNQMLASMGMRPWNAKTLLLRFMAHESFVGARISAHLWQTGELPEGLTRWSGEFEEPSILAGRPTVWWGLGFTDPSKHGDLTEEDLI